MRPQIPKSAFRALMYRKKQSDDMNEIISDFLWLGSLACAANAALLNEFGISHIVNICGMGPNSCIFADNGDSGVMEDASVEGEDGPSLELQEAVALARSRNIVYLRLDLEDVNEAPIDEHFPAVTKLIDDALCRRVNGVDRPLSLLNDDGPLRFSDKLSADGPKVLVHCAAGVSRSATLVLAYLISSRYFALELPEALDLVKKQRPIVCPNSGFYQKLVELQLNQWPKDQKNGKWEKMLPVLREKVPLNPNYVELLERSTESNVLGKALSLIGSWLGRP
ncbi:protein-tyrosine phosphatase-like protein [Cladochytrium replicatum]|nr:protein-tyrosine phosphatase-like protein [Cladochytrium replicatum]